jgi:hypothetical protein
VIVIVDDVQVLLDEGDCEIDVVTTLVDAVFAAKNEEKDDTKLSISSLDADGLGDRGMIGLSAGSCGSAALLPKANSILSNCTTRGKN